MSCILSYVLVLSVKDRSHRQKRLW